jgi:hypothetical protein
MISYGRAHLTQRGQSKGQKYFVTSDFAMNGDLYNLVHEQRCGFPV